METTETKIRRTFTLDADVAQALRDSERVPRRGSGSRRNASALVNRLLRLELITSAPEEPMAYAVDRRGNRVP